MATTMAIFNEAPDKFLSDVAGGAKPKSWQLKRWRIDLRVDARPGGSPPAPPIAETYKKLQVP